MAAEMYEPPINWTDFEDIAMKLYEKFGDDFNEKEFRSTNGNVLRRQVLNKVVESPAIFIGLGTNGFPIAARVGLGQIWFISEHFAITTELGLGGTPLQIGATVNF